MMSPAQRHLQRAAARARAGAADVQRLAAPVGEAYLVERARLGVDLRQLREIQSLEKKIAAKRTMLPAYAGWVEGVLASDEAGERGTQDDILVQVMIWRMDVGDWADALPLAAYVLRWGLTLPERFNRTPATLIVEETAEAALKTLGQDADFPIDVLEEVKLLTEDADMPDQVRSKLCKALGLAHARLAAATAPNADGPAGAKRAALERSVSFLKRAAELDRGSGVKKETQRLVRELTKLAPASEGEAT